MGLQMNRESAGLGRTWLAGPQLVQPEGWTLNGPTCIQTGAQAERIAATFLGKFFSQRITEAREWKSEAFGSLGLELMY